MSRNLLAQEKSPYLLQHKDNPIHWFAWGEEAFRQAREQQKPIFLSIGYSTCHWCHVMAHESFEDAEVADQLNLGFVCIKVDREERPDIDAVYMNATVALTGQGGWPMTCFLTPDGRPFYCGTYYPKEAFLQLLSAVRNTWEERRDEVEQSSDHIAGELRSTASGLPGGGPSVDPALCDHAVAAVLRDEDTVRGGFGGGLVGYPMMAQVRISPHSPSPRDLQLRKLLARVTAGALRYAGIMRYLDGGG